MNKIPLSWGYDLLFMGRQNNHRFVFLFISFISTVQSQAKLLKQISRKCTTTRMFFSVNNHILIEMTGSCYISVMKPLTFRSVEQF